MPFAVTAKERSSDEFIDKTKKGPIAFITVLQNGPPTMGKELVLWFVYCVVIGIFAAYVAGRALGPGAHYLAVFRFAGTTAFAGYALALIPQPIWFKRA